MENAHIKSFFKFLQAKENRDIPIEIKVHHFPNEFTDEDAHDLLFGPYSTFIRGKYFTNKIKNRHWTSITPFGEFGPSIALGRDYNGKYYFINLEGLPDVTGIDTEQLLYTQSYHFRNGTQRLIEPEWRGAYFNTLTRKDQYSVVGVFGAFAKDIARARLYKGSWIFINTKGIPDITGLNIDDIDDLHVRAAYYNVLTGRNDLLEVYDFYRDDNSATGLTIRQEYVKIYRDGRITDF